MLKPRIRRSGIEIIADILHLLRFGDASKAEIIRAVNIGYYQAQNYLNKLLKLRLLGEVIAENRLVSYRVTEKGLRLLTEIEDVRGMLRTEKLPEFLHAGPELSETVGEQH